MLMELDYLALAFTPVNAVTTQLVALTMNSTIAARAHLEKRPESVGSGALNRHPPPPLFSLGRWDNTFSIETASPQWRIL